jgi:hypothetical protein
MRVQSCAVVASDSVAPHVRARRAMRGALVASMAAAVATLSGRWAPSTNASRAEATFRRAAARRDVSPRYSILRPFIRTRPRTHWGWFNGITTSGSRRVATCL